MKIPGMDANETNWVHQRIINHRNTHGYYEEHHMQRNEHFIIQRCYGEVDQNWPFVDLCPLRLEMKLAGL
jgi:hypothetical protein